MLNCNDSLNTLRILDYFPALQLLDLTGTMKAASPLRPICSSLGNYALFEELDLSQVSYRVIGMKRVVGPRAAGRTIGRGRASPGGGMRWFGFKANYSKANYSRTNNW